MRLALFSVINLLAALLLGIYANAQGYGAGMIAVFVVATLIVLQLAYVIWLVVMAGLPDRKPSHGDPIATDSVLRNNSHGALTSAPNGPGNRAP